MGKEIVRDLFCAFCHGDLCPDHGTLGKNAIIPVQRVRHLPAESSHGPEVRFSEIYRKRQVYSWQT